MPKDLRILHWAKFLLNKKSRKIVYFSFLPSYVNYGNLRRYIQNQIEENIHLSEKKQLE